MADTTLLDLKNLVRQELLAYTELQTVSMASDGRESYYLGDSPIIDGTMQCWQNDIEIINTTGLNDLWSIDLNTGLFLFTVGHEPAPDSELLWRFRVEPWAESLLTEAINSAINDCKDVFFSTALDETTVVGDGVAQEYELPADCAFLREVWTASGTSWEKEYDWVTFEGNNTSYIRFIGTVPQQAVRLRYIMDVNLLTEDTDVLEPLFTTPGVDEPVHANLRPEARDAILYHTCWRLVDQSLLPRARNNVFLNAEGSNAIRTIDLIRSADRYAQRYQTALLRANKRPRFWRSR
jgi:hypothetical protein